MADDFKDSEFYRERKANYDRQKKSGCDGILLIMIGIVVTAVVIIWGAA